MSDSLDQQLLDSDSSTRDPDVPEVTERNYRLTDQGLAGWVARLKSIAGAQESFAEELGALNDLHPADLSDLVEALPRELAHDLIEQLGRDIQPALWPELDSAVREDLIDVLPPAAMAEVITELEADDAVDVLEDLDKAQQDAILASLPAAERWAVKDALRYPEYSAGRLMAREVVALPKDWTVGHAIDFMRISDDLPDSFYEVFLIDATHRPVGQLALSKVLRTKRRVRLEDLVEDELTLISPNMDQEELAHQFRQYGLVSAPIVEDDSGRLIGVVTVDDVVHVIDEEAEDDMMKLVGMSSGERDVQRSVRETAKNRFVWLAVNLGTAVVASLIIAMFQGTIDQIVALAVLMPIVASMGGNAGTQTLAVTIRALTMKDLRSTGTLSFVRRELFVGMLNGVGFAVIAGVLATLWFNNPMLGGVIAIAMVVNMVVAGLSGALVPLALNRFGIDPANASTVFLTTITDVVGFFAFLGLAALFLVK